MRKIVALSLGFTVATGCSWYESSWDDSPDWATIDTAYYQNDVAEFARGETLTDQATVWGSTTGFALGRDDYGAVGMVGMVCSFATADGYLRMDVDPDGGDELVVDAVIEGAGFATVSIDTNQVTVTEFPSEWEGGVAVDVAVAETPIDAGLADGQIVVVQDHARCAVQRLDRTTGVLFAEIELDGACLSDLVVDPDGTATISTTEAIFQVAPDNDVVDLGAPASVIAWDADRRILVAGDKFDASLRAIGPNVDWSIELDGGLATLDFIRDGRIVVGIAGSERGALVVLDVTDGSLIERVNTAHPFTRVQASPQGGMLAVRSPMGVHLVRVTE